jgi:hypothetical protein
MKKKLLSLLMACAMLLALAVPAFAADEYFEYDSESDQLTQPIEFQARTFVPTVKLSLPKINENPVVLNPYKIEYSVSIADANKLNGVGMAAVGTNADAANQVISPVYRIKNQTDVKLNYAVVATATTEGNLSLASAQVPANDTGNKAYVAVVLRKASVAAGNITSNDSDTAATLDGSDKANYETLVLKSTGEAKTDNAQPKYLDAASSTAENYLEFQFQGSLSRLSTKPWSADDKLTVNMTFTFTPETAVDVTGTTVLTFANDYSIASGTATNLTTANLETGSGKNIAEVTNAATDPDWVIVSAGAYAAKINKTPGSNGAAATYTLSLDKAKVDAYIAAKKPDGTAYAAGNTITDKVILGYMDNKGFPRTVSVPVKITLAT